LRDFLPGSCPGSMKADDALRHQASAFSMRSNAMF
jgi:hypothetical protein